MQTDIITQPSNANSMCKFTERILRSFQVINDTKSKLIIVFKEFIIHGLLKAFGDNT